MSTHSRVRRLALAALCAGGTVGGTALMAAPGQALAATCSNVFGSGSTLQTKLQQVTFTAVAGTDGAFSNCSATPNVYYNTDGSNPPVNQGGTGSGAGLTEFALRGSPIALTPSKSSNGSWLDGFIGATTPPSASAMAAAAMVASSHPEVVPIVQAPVAIIVHLPAGCSISSQPVFTNTDLSKAFANTSTQHIDWSTLLTDAGASPSGCPSTGNPTVQVRSDSSGTSFATKQYLSQIDSPTWSSFVSDNVIWPGTVSTTYTVGGVTMKDQGSGGEAQAVVNTVGSIGYVNLADARGNTFTNYANRSGSSTMWVEVQNNGTSNRGVTGANPDTSGGPGNCPSSYSATTPPSGDEADWTGVHAANPNSNSVTRGSYPLCTLTYDVAWQSYSGSPVLSPLYTGKYPGETPLGVAVTTNLYLSWVVNTGRSQGQSVVPNDYNKLPTGGSTPTIQSAAHTIAINQVGQN